MAELRCPSCNIRLPAESSFCFQCGSSVSGAYERIPMAKRLRFQVFKRDSFTCTYCGAKAPQMGGRAVLHVDHVVPVAEGGTNDLSNLVTACDDCNRGKGAELLDDDSYLVEIERQRREETAREKALEELRRRYETANQRVMEAYTQAEKTFQGRGIIDDKKHPIVQYERRVARRDRIAPNAQSLAKQRLRDAIAKLPMELRFVRRIEGLQSGIEVLKHERRVMQKAIQASTDEQEIAWADEVIDTIDNHLPSLEQKVKGLQREYKVEEARLEEETQVEKRRSRAEERRLEAEEARKRQAIAKRRQTIEANRLKKQQEEEAARATASIEIKKQLEEQAALKDVEAANGVMRFLRRRGMLKSTDRS